MALSVTGPFLGGKRVARRACAAAAGAYQRDLQRAALGAMHMREDHSRQRRGGGNLARGFDKIAT